MRRRVFAGVLWILVAGMAMAMTVAARAEEENEGLVPGAALGVKAVRLDDIEWTPGPFPGSKIAVLAGDPKTGMHHTYLKLPAATFVPPHWHSTDEYITVVEGTLLLGIGEKADRAKARLYGNGAFVLLPAKVPHYVWAKSQCVLSQTRSGAVDFHWINPDDDPAKKAGKMSGDAAAPADAGKKSTPSGNGEKK